jgi:hypothetical protein
MKSPDNKYEVQKIDYNEVRMGSPLFGSLKVKGSPVNLKGRLFGEPMCISPDSKYLAVQELNIGKDGSPNTKLVLIDLAIGNEITVRHLSGGFINPLSWESNERLEFESVIHSKAGPIKKRFVYKLGET